MHQTNLSKIYISHSKHIMYVSLLLFSNSLRSNENYLIYFFQHLGGSASRAVLSCNKLRENKVTIFLS